MFSLSTQNYMAEKYIAGKLPHRAVSRAEFVRLMMKKGLSRDKANLQATVCAAIGGHTRIGKEMLTVRKEKKR